MAHLNAHSLFDPYQSAYRPGHSTETALLKIKNDFDLALDRGQGVALVLLDLSAAFDTIDHCILLERLENHCGITGCALEWVRSYLTDRTQSVVIGDMLSDPLPLDIGVPQGSVLGPLLFTIYMLPIGHILREHGILYHGYADDTQLYLLFNPKDPQSLPMQMARLEKCLAKIHQWLIRNKLQLNADKTEFILQVAVHLKTLVQKLRPSLRVGDAVVHPTDCVRDLGVHLDSQLSMRPYINQTTRSIHGHLRSLRRIRRHLDDAACAKAVQALVVSRLDYANSLLSGVPDCALRKLQVAQNSAARLLSATDRRQHITPVLKDLHWLPVRQRIAFKMLSLTFQALHSESAPCYLRSLLVQDQRRPLRSNSSAVQLLAPCTKKNIGEHSFAVRGPKLWNSLPANLRNSTSYPTFKRNLKTFLFKQHFGS